MENYEEEHKVTACFDCLENPDIDVDQLDEKERLAIAMSSYYMVYR